ncbi:SDR family NAD(P)-dependent oxidoreductase [Clostridium merdae]|uniref:SDR family NAD(P)-dependent oxidoreductase n=1 Tax=Clostridium merdae TaxID=1958780 RepID=UPI000A269DA6|nr:SDR family oxidoreductase [Clostridium merdae]
MKALITGASSGIGRDMARILSRRGYDLILVARRRDRLEELQHHLPSNVKIICCDLRDEKACFALYEQAKGENIDILINNAGFGLFGSFLETDLHRELELLDVNVRAVHILTKLFLRDFVKRDSGYILNVSSSAAFLPGPLLSSYYASKAYVLRLTQAVGEELRRKGSHVYIGALCPGPVKTEFDQVADVHFSVKSMSSQRVAMIAIQQMFSRQPVIIPGSTMKLSKFFMRAIPDSLLVRISYHMQKRKQGPERDQ